MADLTLTKTIRSAKVIQKKAEFLREHPNKDTINDPNFIPDPENPIDVPQIKKYSDKEWIMHCMWGRGGYFLRECKAGHKKLLQDSTVFDDDI